MYLEHSDRLLTRYDCSTPPTRGSSIYRFCTDYLSSLNIFYCLKLFYLNICSIYTSSSIYASYLNTLWYIRNAQILRVTSSTALHAKNSRQLNIQILSSLNIFYCLKLSYLNICSIYANYSISASDSIYTIYPNLTSTTPHTKNSCN